MTTPGRVRRRSAVYRFALALMAIAQLAGALLAPAAEARTDRANVVHVEQAGTRLHHAHVESLCPSCVAQQLFGPTPAGGVVPAASRQSTLPRSAATIAHAAAEWFDPASARAPPAR
ncbi:MAG: hypothetical protein WKG32_07345 [Gemmatimonadaceae bacterium]